MTQKRGLSSKLMSELQKKRELRSWILDRLNRDEVNFSEDQLLEAVHKFGSDTVCVVALDVWDADLTTRHLQGRWDARRPSSGLIFC